ncbi:MAG: YncE family protein [Terriglobales bacterium]
MKRLSVLLALLVIASAFLLAADAPLYKKTNEFPLAGEGGWDYLAWDADGNRLFIAHGTQFLVINTDNGQQLGSVPANGAHGVAIATASGHGFSTNGRAGTVTAFDLKTLKPIQDIKAGDGPDAIIYDEHSQRVIVMNGHSKDLMVINPESFKVDATIPLGGKLEFAAADKGHVYVNVEDAGEIAVIDSKTWKATARWKLPDCEEPSGLAIDEKEHHLFSVCGNSKMMVLDTESGKVLATLPTGDGTDAAGFDPELHRAFASNGAGTLTVVQAKGKDFSVAGNVETAKGARTMALDPKTHRVFLVTADFGPKPEGEKRPPIKPGTFRLMVFSPAQ